MLFLLSVAQPGTRCSQALTLEADSAFAVSVRSGTGPSAVASDALAEQYCPGSGFDGTGNATWIELNVSLPAWLQLTTCDSASTFDTDLAVFRGASCEDLVAVACSGDAALDKPRCQSGYSEVRVELREAVNERYYAVVSGYRGASGNVKLHATRVNVPPSLPPTPPPWLPPLPPPSPAPPCALVIVRTETADFGSEVSWIIDGGSATLDVTLPDSRVYWQTVCLEDGPHTLQLLDSGGDGWHGGEVSMTRLGHELLRESLVNDGTVDNGAKKLVNFDVWPLPPSPPAAPLNCPCIGEFPQGTLASTSANSTYLPVLYQGEPYNYSSGYGLHECAAHDRDMPPGCDDTRSAPTWCDKLWCYVDINACNTEYAASVLIYGRKLFYSYQVCGSIDEFSIGLKSGRSRCAPGLQPNEADAALCEFCPAGTAKGVVGNKACVTCAPGRFAEGSALECSPCAEGTYVAVAGAAHCAPCPTGLSAAEGATECSLCAVGYFDVGLGAGCEVCPKWADCSSHNLTLQTVPLKRGYWRLSAMTADVRACATDSSNGSSCLGACWTPRLLPPATSPSDSGGSC